MGASGHELIWLRHQAWPAGIHGVKGAYTACANNAGAARSGLRPPLALQQRS